MKDDFRRDKMEIFRPMRQVVHLNLTVSYFALFKFNWNCPHDGCR